MQIFSLLLQLLTSGYYLYQSIKSLLTEKRLFSYPEIVTEYSRGFRLQIEPIKEKDMLEFQIEIEKLFHKNQLMPRIREEFTGSKEIDFPGFIRSIKMDQDFCIDLLVQMVLHKRAKLPVLVGCLRSHFDNDAQKTADELLKAAEADLVNWSPVTKEFIIKFGISADVQEEIDRYQYPMPMVVEPKELTCNHDSAYYTGGGSVILRKNHHEEDVCLDHLNQANKIRFKINQDVSTTVKNKWKNLDKPNPDEEVGEYQKRVKAFEKYNRTAHDVINHLGLAEEGEFYLTHRYDKRGRTYSQGYHVNYQGAPWNKAVIEFANQEVTQ